MGSTIDDGRPGAPGTDDLEALRPALLRHCYRMLGSAADSEDAVQETVVRAHRRIDRYDPTRAKLSTWVHTIATRICLDHLRGARRRALLLGSPADDGGDIGSPLSPDHWVEPVPGSMLFGSGSGDDPAERAVERETVRLAFVALVQHLPPRQRAVLLLREVLGFSAAETAGTLETSVPAVNSALQRARATLADVDAATSVSGPPDPGSDELVQRYLTAWHAHDVAGLTAVLHQDAVTSMPPFAWWLRGAERIAGLIADSDACATDRLVPVDVNGGPGFGQYRPDAAGVLRPFALVVPEVVGDRIGHVITFLGTGERFAEFGLPATVAPRS